MKAKQYTSKQPMDHWRNQRENSKNTYRQMKTKTQWSKKSMWCSKSSPKGEIYSDTSLPQEIGKISSNITLHLKEL